MNARITAISLFLIATIVASSCAFANDAVDSIFLDEGGEIIIRSGDGLSGEEAEKEVQRIKNLVTEMAANSETMKRLLNGATTNDEGVAFIVVHKNQNSPEFGSADVNEFGEFEARIDVGDFGKIDDSTFQLVDSDNAADLATAIDTFKKHFEQRTIAHEIGHGHTGKNLQIVTDENGNEDLELVEVTLGEQIGQAADKNFPTSNGLPNDGAEAEISKDDFDENGAPAGELGFPAEAANQVGVELGHKVRRLQYGFVVQTKDENGVVTKEELFVDWEVEIQDGNGNPKKVKLRWRMHDNMDKIRGLDRDKEEKRVLPGSVLDSIPSPTERSTTPSPESTRTAQCTPSEAERSDPNDPFGAVSFNFDAVNCSCEVSTGFAEGAVIIDFDATGTLDLGGSMDAPLQVVGASGGVEFEVFEDFSSFGQLPEDTPVTLDILNVESGNRVQLQFEKTSTGVTNAAVQCGG